jgi:ribosome maturation factor RimP
MGFLPIFYIWCNYLGVLILVKLNKKIEELAIHIINAMGYELWGIELHQSGRHTIVRVYIDVPLGDDRRSVNVDDCSRVSNQIGALFDVENLISGSYNLEVSSPGLDRPLFRVEHYRRYIGHSIYVRLQQPKNGQRKFAGKIHAIFDDRLEMLVDNEIIAFELMNINKANLMAEMVGASLSLR